MFGRKKKPKSRVDAEGLVVGEQDVVQGTMTVQSATVTGRVEGHVTAATTLIITPTGAVHGTIAAARLIIEGGATVRAVCRVGYPADAQPAERAPGERSAVLKLTPRGMPGVPPRDGRGNVGGAAAGG